MDNNIQTTNLVIQSVEDKGSQMKFKGSDGRTYSFWKQKKDGSMTAAFAGFQNFKIGDTINVAYKDEQSTKYPGTTFHTVISIKAASGVPEVKNAVPRANSSVKEGVQPSTRNFDREAYEKCCSIWAAALMKAGDTGILSAIETGQFWKVFQAIRKEGANRFKGTVDVDGIPF